MASVAMIGPGAIGGAAGYALLQTGKHQLTICAHQRFETLTLTRAGAEQAHAFSPVTVITKPEDAAPADWVLLAVKSNQTEGASDWLRRAVGPNTKLAILQNGVEHRERVAPFVAKETPLVPVVVQLPAQRTAPGVIATYGPTLLIVGDDAASCEFAALFDGSFMNVQVDDDFKTRQWEKLCLNAASGALTTLTMNPDCIATVSGMKELCAAVTEECVAVGRADGAKFADGFAQSLTNILAARTGNRGNSMYYDRRDGKELEWDARNGVIARLGKKYNVPTPISDVLVPLLRAINAR